MRIHDDRRAGIGAVSGDPGAQLALDDVLELLVDGQLEGAAGGGQPLDAAEAAAPGVDLHQHLAVAAADHRVVGRLDAAQAAVVDADVAEQLRRQLLLRVVAAALLHEADALEIEGGDPRRRLRGDEPLDEGEGPRRREALDHAP